jgi:hypothetical protein|tara:strand:+ start:1443 stop:1550 length:108 start_codon:yes stop_codon:yes gene_type:complete
MLSADRVFFAQLQSPRCNIDFKTDRFLGKRIKRRI